MPSNPTLSEFLILQHIRNTWLNTEDSNFEAYVRRSRRVLNNKQQIPSFDIANVGAILRGNGSFTRFLNNIEELLSTNDEFKNGIIFIENVLSPRFELYLRARDYRVWQQQIERYTPPSYYKHIK